MTQTIASCYSKIGDILSEAEDYNEALTCNEELKEMYNKIDDMLFNLGREDSAIIFYRKNNKLDSILKCYDSLINKAEKPIKYDLYMTQGNELCFQNNRKQMLQNHILKQLVLYVILKNNEMQCLWHTIFLGNPNNNIIQQTDISEQQQREGYLNGIIGDIIDL